MPEAVQDTLKERVPLLSKHNHGINQTKKEVPVIRARIVLTIVSVFAMAPASAKDSLVAQYVVNRLGSDAGYLNHTQFSQCFKDLNDSRIKLADSIQTEASQQLTYFGYAQSIPAFIICLFIGSYTDILGRRFLLILPLFTNMVKMALITAVIKFHLDLRYMYLAYGIDGVAGSWFTVLLAQYAVTADISLLPKDRTFWIYFIGCSSSIMEALSNIADGYLIEYYSFFEASLFLSIMMATAFVIPAFFMPETFLDKPEEKRLNPFIHMKRIFGFYIFDGSVRKRATYCLGLLLFILAIANLIYISSIDALYQMHQPFCWSSTQIGYYSSLRSAGACVTGALILKFLQRCVSDEHIGMIGLLFQGGAFIFEAFLRQSWQFYLVPILGSPNAPLTSIVRSMLSRLSAPDKQGALFSSIAVVETLVNLTAVFMWNKIYGATVNYMPGLVYLVMAGLSFLTFVLFIVYLCIHEKPSLQKSVDVERPEIQ